MNSLNQLILTFTVLVASCLPGVQTKFDYSTGIRSDSLSWNIGLEEGPDILSELQWKNMLTVTSAVDLSVLFTPSLYAELSFRSSPLTKGKCQDSDYLGADRTIEFSRSYSSVIGGNLYDADMVIGYKDNFDGLTISPHIGLGWHRQDIQFGNGRQILYLDQETEQFYVFEDPIYLEGLDSRYRADYLGPFIGCELSVPLLQRNLLAFAFRYHWLNYEGVGDWNLREELLDFVHESSGGGLELGAKLSSLPNVKGISWGVGVHWRNFCIGRGVDTIHFIENGEMSAQQAIFNGAKSTAFTMDLQLSYQF